MKTTTYFFFSWQALRDFAISANWTHVAILYYSNIPAILHLHVGFGSTIQIFPPFYTFRLDLALLFKYSCHFTPSGWVWLLYSNIPAILHLQVGFGSSFQIFLPFYAFRLGLAPLFKYFRHFTPSGWVWLFHSNIPTILHLQVGFGSIISEFCLCRCSFDLNVAFLLPGPVLIIWNRLLLASSQIFRFKICSPRGKQEGVFFFFRKHMLWNAHRVTHTLGFLIFCPCLLSYHKNLTWTRSDSLKRQICWNLTSLEVNTRFPA